MFNLSTQAEINNYGKFTDTRKVEWKRNSDNKRDMILINEFSYIAPKGKKWKAPKGYVTDGASIPRIFWSLVGGPFDEQYREVALIHDVYCDSQSKLWQDVYHIFYYTNRAAGISEFKLKVLYDAVRFGGLRWNKKAPSNYFSGCHATGSSQKYIKTVSPTKKISENVAKSAIKWIKKNNSSIDEIDQHIEKLIKNDKSSPIQ